MNPLLKHRIKKASAFLGIHWRDNLPRRTTMEQFCKHLKQIGFVPGSIVDVGVADGTFEIYSVFPKTPYLLVEPMAEFETALNRIAATHDVRIELVGAGSRETSMSIIFDPSLAAMHGATLSAPDPGTPQKSARSIPVRRLDALVAKHNLAGPILIKVDTQGTEHDVVSGAEAILPMVEVIILETSFFRFEYDQPLFHETLAFMAGKGFVPYDLFGGFNRPLDGALGQIDVAFVKRDSALRKDDRYSDASLPLSAIRRAINATRRVLKV